MSDAPFVTAILNLSALGETPGMPGLTPSAGQYLADGAAVCFHRCGHRPPIRLSVEGWRTRQYNVISPEVTDQMQHTYDQQEACRLESVAAEALLDEPDAEPTRSVLFRSAASLAVEARQFARAAYLVASGLAGSPPEEIRQELRELLQTVRREGKLELAANEELGRSDLVGRYLSGCTYLGAAAEYLLIALSDRTLKGRRLSGRVTEVVLNFANDALQTATGDTSIYVDLFCCGTAGLAEYVPVGSAELFSGGWFQFARRFVFDHEDVLLRAKPIAGQIDELLREGTLSRQWAATAREAGIQALAANPICAVNEEQVYQPALVLLTLASQGTAFADQRACQILLETVSLLEIAIQIGRREEIFKLRIESDDGTDEQSEESQIRGRDEEN